ncbi:hypothetical protein L4C42_15810 [Vibrio wakamikoensis]|uniref:O-succinylbenzoic acid--CoA ligase n=1 Tax=Vibrio chaetopteri TaxID=3016528 RepID=A0AAU8BLM8_9VIBR
MNKLLMIAIGLQIGLALTSEGLSQALAELTAFLLTAILYLNHKKSKSASNKNALSPSTDINNIST